MGALRQGFGEQISPPSGAAFSSVTTVASTQIGGLSSRQVLFGSSTGGIAQSTAWQFDSTQEFIGLHTSAPAALFDMQQTSGGQPFQIWRTSAGVELVRLSSQGRFGIGTTNPRVPLEISGNDAVYWMQSTASLADERIWQFIASSLGTLEFRTADDAITAGNNWLIVDRAGVSIRHVEFRTGAGLLAIHMNTSAHVGIGTTSPTDPLHVAGSVRFSSLANSTVSFFGAAGSTQASSYTTGAITSARTFPSTFDGTTVSTLAFTGGLSDRVNTLTTVVLAMLRVQETMAKDLGVGGVGYGLLR